MLMSRIVYFSVAGLLVALNAAGLAVLFGGDTAPRQVVTVALMVNLFIWPLALAIAYRVGQATQSLKTAKEHGAHKH